MYDARLDKPMQLIQKLKPVLYGIIILAIVLGLPLLFTSKEEKPYKLVYEENITKEIPPDGAHLGDLVVIDYVISLPQEKNKVIDTNNEELAKQYGLKTFTNGPFRMIVGKSGKVKGFDQTILGMRAGETREQIILPSEPPTQQILNKTQSFARNQPLPKFYGFTLPSFEKLFKRQPRINDVVSNQKFPWPFKVTNITKEGVILEVQIKEGQEITLPGLSWKSQIIVVKKQDFMVRHNPKEGQTIKTELGQGIVTLSSGRIFVTNQLEEGQLINYSRQAAGISTTRIFKVLSILGDRVVIQRDDNPAEKKLTLKVTLLDRTPTQKSP